MRLKEQEIIEELEQLRDFLYDVEIAAEVIQKSKLVEETVLLVCLPSVEDIEDEEEEEEIDPEKIHIASGYILDLDDADQRLAKYLMFYTQIRTDISAMTTEEVLDLVNQLNQTVRVGHYFYGEADGEESPIVQYRATVTGAEGEHFDGGIVADTIIEMGVGYDIAKSALIEKNEECKKRKGN